MATGSLMSIISQPAITSLHPKCHQARNCLLTRCSRSVNQDAINIAVLLLGRQVYRTSKSLTAYTRYLKS